MLHLDSKIHVMMCSRCYHLNEISLARCARCFHDAGIPLFRESAERSREVHARLLTSVRGAKP